MSHVIQSSKQGYAVARLRTGFAELALVPGLGGRVIGIHRLASGREWCWHRPGPRWLWSSKPYDSFGDSPQAGIDECLPSVAACRVRGRDIPDHGELWYRSWSLDSSALRAGVLDSTLGTSPSPFLFRRAISAPEENVFRFAYTLTSLSAEPEPYLWCLHPLLTIEPDDRIELPASVRSLRLNGGVGAPMRHGERWDYPEPLPGLRLDRLEAPGMPGGCVKAFAGPLNEGWAAISNARTGERLELRWDPAFAPQLGFWLNRGFLGFHHVALEPSTGAPDSLTDAIDSWKQVSVLAPGEIVSWHVDWILS